MWFKSVVLSCTIQPPFSRDYFKILLFKWLTERRLFWLLRTEIWHSAQDSEVSAAAGKDKREMYTHRLNVCIKPTRPIWQVMRRKWWRKVNEPMRSNRGGMASWAELEQVCSGRAHWWLCEWTDEAWLVLKSKHKAQLCSLFCRFLAWTGSCSDANQKLLYLPQGLRS